MTLMSAALLQSAPVAANAHGQCSVVEVKKNVNVRTRPSKNSSKVGYIEVGQKYVEVQRSGAWHQIWYDNKKRWVSGNGYVQSSEGECIQIGNTQTGYANVRDDDKNTANKLGAVKNQSLWVVKDKLGSWVKVWYDSKSGYIHSNYIKDVEDPFLADVIRDTNFLFCLQENQFYKASEVVSAVCIDRGIETLSGIEYLTSLKQLYLHNKSSDKSSWNKFEHIDLSKNMNLEKLKLDNNQLFEIDLSKNQNLKMLSMSNNILESIDLSNNTKLEDLNLEGNELEEIDLRSNAMLSWLILDDNYLTDIALGNNKALQFIYIARNKLSTADVSLNTELLDLDLSGNYLECIELMQNKKLENIALDDNKITAIRFDNNPKLNYLSISNNNLEAIDVNQNTELSYLKISDNQIETITLINNVDVTSLLMDSSVACLGNRCLNR